MKTRLDVILVAPDFLFRCYIEEELESLLTKTPVRIFALLAICATLVITTASVLPGHEHENGTARPCDICHSGHLPCLQPSNQIQLHAHMPVVWQHTTERFQCCLDTFSTTGSPRAPPV